MLHGLRSTPGPGGRPKSWHVLEVKPFYGHAVDRFIEFKRDAVGADWELFNPKVRAQKKWSRGRTGVSVRSYLPGYVFARFDVDDGKWPHLNDVIGIDSVMYSVGNDPATVRDAVICDLMGRCAVEYEDGDFEQRKPRYFIDEAEADAYLFKVGSLVRMTEGPFKDMVGEVKMSTRMKVTVIFSVFNRDSRVEAKPGNLELV